jgi:hypothetical protein
LELVRGHWNQKRAKKNPSEPPDHIWFQSLSYLKKHSPIRKSKFLVNIRMKLKYGSTLTRFQVSETVRGPWSLTICKRPLEISTASSFGLRVYPPHILRSLPREMSHGSCHPSSGAAATGRSKNIMVWSYHCFKMRPHDRICGPFMFMRCNITYIRICIRIFNNALYFF